MTHPTLQPYYVVQWELGGLPFPIRGTLHEAQLREPLKRRIISEPDGIYAEPCAGMTMVYTWRRATIDEASELLYRGADG